MKQDLKIRQSLMEFQSLLMHGIDDGTLEDCEDKTKLEHHFTPVDPQYGCSSYARQLFMPAGMVVAGAIHKKPHLTMLMQGTMIVISEDGGRQRVTGPKTFVSPAGTKRVFHIEKDSTLVCVHLTAHSSEADLEAVEAEVLSPTYAEMGLEEPDLSDLEEFLGTTTGKIKKIE